MREIETIDQFNAAINQRTIVMFTAGWCPDCHFIQPFLPEIEAAHPNYQFLSVNRDQLMDLAVDYDVMGIPSFLAFDKGSEIGRFVSKDRKTAEEINAFIDGL